MGTGRCNNLLLDPEKIATFLQGVPLLQKEEEGITAWTRAEKKQIPLLGLSLRGTAQKKKWDTSAEKLPCGGREEEQDCYILQRDYSPSQPSFSSSLTP